jgi:hypothetical protein
LMPRRGRSGSWWRGGLGMARRSSWRCRAADGLATTERLSRG